MPVCAACGQMRELAEQQVVRTARLLSSSSDGNVGYRITTNTYGEFRDHVYFVCSACKARDRTLLPAAYVALGVVALVLLVVSVANELSVFAILAMFVGIAGLAMLVVRSSSSSKLARLAVRERGGGGANPEYVVLTPGK